MPKVSSEQRFNVGEMELRVLEIPHHDRLMLRFVVETDADCRLHWGLERRVGLWHRPAPSMWPPQTQGFNEHAVQSPFVEESQGKKSLELHLDLAQGWRYLPFVLFFPERARWGKHAGQDLRLTLPRLPTKCSAREMLGTQTGSDAWAKYDFELDHQESLVAAVKELDEAFRLLLACDAQPPLFLHWGLSRGAQRAWQIPPEESRPPASIVFDGKAVRTPFVEHEGVRWLELTLPKKGEPSVLRGVHFVLFQPDDGRWLKVHGQDMFLPLQSAIEDNPEKDISRRELVEQIMRAEVGKNSWTLMHRFDLCHDLLATIGEDEDEDEDEEALVLLFIWLRYSALRQLDWQRHYNTKPRELAHAQDRLSMRLANLHKQNPRSRIWTRQMLASIGQGGSRGQQVRDDILNIMHRHKIKRAGERFMEEWHQKLHNNTTPDDIVICEAYLDFLESEGDLTRFYQTLANGGVTRERLQSFDRPITSDPGFYSEKKDGLVTDFRNYLKVLKSVHSSADLETAVISAQEVLDEKLSAKLDSLVPECPRELPPWIRPKDRHKPRQGNGPHRLEPRSSRSHLVQFLSISEQARNIVELRSELESHMERTEDVAVVRKLLYLDIALEDTLRRIIEGQALEQLSDESLVSLIYSSLLGLCQSIDVDELRVCARDLAAVIEGADSGSQRHLRTKAVFDRTARVLRDWSETVYAMVQPKAELLGKRLNVEDWVMPIFTEEVLRGGLAFPLSLLLRRMDAVVRERIGLGGWQIISPAHVSGQVRYVESLMSVQGTSYRSPVVLITERVSGEEEVPEGANAIITTDSPDLLSHVAVRARNSRVLFASCFDPHFYAELLALEGQGITLWTNTAGEVEYSRGASTDKVHHALPRPSVHRRSFTQWAVASEKFDPECVGGKAYHLNLLRDKLPQWIHFPVSIAFPFGVFEEILEHSQNRDVKTRLEALWMELATNPQAWLPKIRQTINKLVPVDALREAVDRVWDDAGLPRLAWNEVWRGVTRVWASKWNNRAYYSRVTHGILHEDLTMAVLIQELVQADYAFVMHTVNPFTKDENELYIEMVPGLGEALVGNYPGRALSIVCRKAQADFSIAAYPSKSIGLYSKGLIFRSDSNGEDREEFAGAGLYDSFLSQPPTARLLSYAREPLVADPSFIKWLATRLLKLGITVEEVFGRAQDIEGAVQAGRFYVVQSRPQVGL
jgi:alpha-glucan,water dikinase